MDKAKAGRDWLNRLLGAMLALVLLCACGTAGGRAVEEASPAAEGTELTVCCFSAGSADAFLLHSGEGAVLIDCGEKGFGKEIVAYMEQAGLERLDYLIITHFDQDHVGGAAKVINSVPVGAVLQSNHPKDSGEYEKYVKALGNAGLEPQTVREQMSFTLDGVAYTVDPPRKDNYSSSDSNNSSLIVTVQDGGSALLFTGDAEDERMAEFLSWSDRAYDVLKMPHHGRWQDTLPALVASAKPAYAIITSSEAEPEDAATLALLEQSGAEVYLTRYGAVLLHCDGKEIGVLQISPGLAA